MSIIMFARVSCAIMLVLGFASATSELGPASNSNCLNDPCFPGNEFCGQPFSNAPTFHLMDQHGCGENDPNGPVFDPVHGVFHHFYQIHLAAAPGRGPDYGHFVSKDLISWSALPVAIWNGLDSSVWPPSVTKYDNEAIYTGSALVIDGAGPGGVGPGIVQIYPGLCNNKDWPNCATGTLLAQAVPANYATDELLVNWTKPSYNPIMENTQRDPSTPWQTPSGEWRLRTYDSKVYGAASAAAVLSGEWYEIGKSESFRTCECPSFYPLPPPTPGQANEAAFAAAKAAGTPLPTHVHKTSCGGDWWQLGTYDSGPANTTGNFTATPGWEDVFAQRRIDAGKFYASKDALYPTLGSTSAKRRVNWGWAQVPPQSTQTLPREITFNAAARVLEQAPLEELKSLRLPAAFGPTSSPITLSPEKPFVLPLQGAQSASVVHSELLVDFELPAPGSMGSDGVVFGVLLGAVLDGSRQVVEAVSAPIAAAQRATASGEEVEPFPSTDSAEDGGATRTRLGDGDIIQCLFHYVPPTNASAPYHEVPVSCGGTRDTLRILPSEKTVSLRIFLDATMIEAYFQHGRVAMTESLGLSAGPTGSGIALTSKAASSHATTVASVALYPLRSIWTSPDKVRQAPRIYH